MARRSSTRQAHARCALGQRSATRRMLLCAGGLCLLSAWKVSAQSQEPPNAEQDAAAAPGPDAGPEVAPDAALAIDQAADAAAQPPTAAQTPSTDSAPDSAPTSTPESAPAVESQPANVAPTLADEAGWGDADPGDAVGFEAQPTAAPAAAETREPGALELLASFRSRAALWTERMAEQPFAQARQSLDLGLRYKKPFALGGETALFRLLAEGHLEYDFAYQHARERFDPATLKAYEYQLIGRETYAALSLGALELKFGRQIVAWGQGEVVSPLDIVNPRDLREPLLADLDAARMALLASRAALAFGAHSLEVMVVHESFFGLRAAPLGDFSPLRPLLLDDPRVASVLPERSLRYRDVPDRFVGAGAQFYGRWAYAGEGLDLAFYVASTLDKQGVLRLPGGSDLASRDIPLNLWHPRYVMFGHSGAKPLGAFVLRWELGFDHARPLSIRDRDQLSVRVDYVLRHRVNALLGVTYTGIDNTRLSLEYAQSLVLDNPERERGSQVESFWPVERPILAARATHSLLRERLTLTAVGMLIGVSPFVGAFVRAELAYELYEALSLSLGYAIYAPSRKEFGPFYGFTEHDRLYATLRWDFVLE